MKQITILPEVIDQIVVDTSGKHPRYIVVGHNKKHMRISPLAYTLLEKVHAGNSFATVAQDLSREGERTIAPEEVQKAYEYVVAKISKISGKKEKNPGGFWFKFPLIPAASVQEIASAFTFMFHPLTMVVALSSIGLLVAYAVVYGGLTAYVPANPIMIIPAYLLFLVSLFAHEFGHASACMKGDVEPSEIGVAVYLFFPVFYSDVSASWQLPRWHKVRVDIGGIYLQLCVGGIYLLLFVITRQAMFQWATFMLVSSCLVSLNPFLKFDGYWVLTDIMDVANLSRQPLYVLNYFYRAIFKKQQSALRWSKGVCITILIYGLLKVVFWIYLLLILLPLIYNTVSNYPVIVASAMKHVHYNNSALLMVDLQGLAINALIVILYGGGICRICIPFLWQIFVTIKNSGLRGWLVQRGGVRSGDAL
ncbi:hypothetical protein [Reticulibacter mediterranei]|nr:hypothetical protein [Reticulibacter mediterranei]